MHERSHHAVFDRTSITDEVCVISPGGSISTARFDGTGISDAGRHLAGLTNLAG
jgi:hypothetical protein